MSGALGLRALPRCDHLPERLPIGACRAAYAKPPAATCPSPRFATLSRAHRTGRGLPKRAALTPSTSSMPRLGRRDALRNDVLKGAARLRSTVEAARGEQSRETLLKELEAILRREIAAEKKTPIPCRRKRKREVLRFSWAPCEKLRGLREVAEALGCGATWTSLDDGRRGLLKAVRKLRASETIERPPEGISVAYLPDPGQVAGRAARALRRRRAREPWARGTWRKFVR